MLRIENVVGSRVLVVWPNDALPISQQIPNPYVLKPHLSSALTLPSKKAPTSKSAINLRAPHLGVDRGVWVSMVFGFTTWGLQVLGLRF